MKPTRILTLAIFCGLSSVLSAATASIGADPAFEATSPYAGGPVTFDAYAGDLGSSTFARWEFVIPEGWTYVSTSAGGPETQPTPGSTGTLKWICPTAPITPLSFTFILNAPAGVSSTQTFSATAYIKNGDVESALPSNTVMLVPPKVPEVATGAATVGSTTATVHGSVDYACGSEITARGFVYSTTDNPKLDAGTSSTTGSGKGSFTASLSGLSPNTTYYFRAYATNALGTGYANVVSFTTAASLVAPTVTSSTSTFDTTPTLSGTAEPNGTLAVAVDGATSGSTTVDANGNWSYTIPAALSTGNHTITLTVADSAGHSSSSSLTLTIKVPSATAPQPDGYAASATGGAAVAPVTVSTAADFIAQATATTARVITVTGSIDIGTVSVASNMTIQGADSSSTLDGCLRLERSNNVIIRGLNIANAAGTGIELLSATNVFIDHCTFLDCDNAQLILGGNTDNVTVSWCEFASTRRVEQASVLIGDGTAILANQPLHVTFHHNWWARNLTGAIPTLRAGYLHQYSNHLDCLANLQATDVRENAQLLSERNVYTTTNSPLMKSGTATVRVIDNVYTGCTGFPPDAGTDTVFTPNYSYEMLATGDVAATIDALAGNTNGANTPAVGTDSASITGPSADLAEGASTTLTAKPSGFTGTTYQWRLNNAPIAGATEATYTIASMSSATLGTYTVEIGLADGSAVVSTPLNVGLVGTPFPGTVIITGPSAAVALGGAATLTAKAGFSPAYYQWFLNNTPISGATGATYAIVSMSSAQAGTYAVAAAMPDGHLVRSADFQLNLATSPTPGTSSGGTSTPSAGTQPGTGSTSSGTSRGGGGGTLGFGLLAALALLSILRRLGRPGR